MKFSLAVLSTACLAHLIDAAAISKQTASVSTVTESATGPASLSPPTAAPAAAAMTARNAMPLDQVLTTIITMTFPRYTVYDLTPSVTVTATPTPPPTPMPTGTVYQTIYTVPAPAPAPADPVWHLPDLHTYACLKYAPDVKVEKGCPIED